MMKHGDAIFAVLLSCVVLTTVTVAKKNKKPSPPQWKSNSMPHGDERFHTEMEKTDFKLDCKASGQPKPSIKWKKDGVPLRRNMSPRMVIKKFGLTLVNMTKEMSGNYTCYVKNDHGSLEYTFIVDVQAEVWPLDVEGPTNVTQMVGASAEFHCRILNDPKATIRWQKMTKKDNSRSNSVFLPDGDDQGVLTLKNVSEKDAGEYRCMTGNINGLMYSSAWLTVIKPIPTTPPPWIWTEDNPDIFDLGPDFSFETTTKQPRKNKKGRRKNGRKKNKKNKNKNNNKFRPTTQMYPSEPSSTYTPSTPSSSSLDYFDRDRESTTMTRIWTFDDRDDVFDGVVDTRYNPGGNDDDTYGVSNGDRVDEGKTGSAVADDGENKGGDVSAWKIYTIVGAVGGVVLLIGLVAITIALCCPKQEGAVYKSTPV